MFSRFCITPDVSKMYWEMYCISLGETTPQNFPFPWGSGLPADIWSVGCTRHTTPIGISVVWDVFAGWIHGSANRRTDRQTDSHRSVPSTAASLAKAQTPLVRLLLISVVQQIMAAAEMISRSQSRRLWQPLTTISRRCRRVGANGRQTDMARPNRHRLPASRVINYSVINYSHVVRPSTGALRLGTCRAVCSLMMSRCRGVVHRRSYCLPGRRLEIHSFINATSARRLATALDLVRPSCTGDRHNVLLNIPYHQYFTFAPL